MNSRSSTPDPDLIIVVDSDNEQEEERPAKGTTRCTKKSQQLPQLPQQQQDAATIQQSFSQNPPNVLQELFGIVQWVNTGVKRDKSCEKTFMEKKVDELESKLKEREQQLELANKGISDLKQSKIDLQKEIEGLQHTLSLERKQKSALDRKWAQMKDNFKTFHSKYFEDAQALQSKDVERHRKLDIGHLKQEPNELDPDAPAPAVVMENQDIPVSTMDQDEASFSGRHQFDHKDDDGNTTSMIGAVVEVQLGPESGIQLQDEQPSTSKTNNNDNSKMTEVNHALDNSKQHLGVFCVCGMHFSSKRTLDSHVIYYTCEKRFLCELCDKRFVGTNYLKGHMLRSHKVSYTGGLNGCRDCGKTFSSLLQLRRHKKLVHYSNYPVRKVAGIVKKDPGTSSTKKRRSIRMKRRHQKGESHSALTMLQGNCNNCKFCREAVKRKPKTQTAPQISNNTPRHHSNSSGAGGNTKTQPPKLHSSSSSASVTLISKPRTRYRSSSVSSDSASFSCDYCSKWFGDDKCGLIKHQQSCQARFPWKNQ